MADRFYSVGLNEQTPNQVTEGAATSGETFELRVTYDATGADKRHVLLALRAIEGYIVAQDTFPPV